jgi:DNA-binding transcriptional ArsR family regulator
MKMDGLDCCDLDDFLKAMANENRQRILVLLQDGEMSVRELEAHFDLVQPTISHHLALLHKAQLVVTRRDGKFVYYRANPDCVAGRCREILARFPGRPVAHASEEDIRNE